jgi:hypothetical protein
VGQGKSYESRTDTRQQKSEIVEEKAIEQAPTDNKPSDIISAWGRGTRVAGNLRKELFTQPFLFS